MLRPLVNKIQNKKRSLCAVSDLAQSGVKTNFLNHQPTGGTATCDVQPFLSNNQQNYHILMSYQRILDSAVVYLLLEGSCIILIKVCVIALYVLNYHVYTVFCLFNVRLLAVF